jgi:hypothetical protein
VVRVMLVRGLVLDILKSGGRLDARLGESMEGVHRATALNGGSSTMVFKGACEVAGCSQIPQMTSEKCT